MNTQSVMEKIIAELPKQTFVPAQLMSSHPDAAAALISAGIPIQTADLVANHLEAFGEVWSVGATVDTASSRAGEPARWHLDDGSIDRLCVARLPDGQVGLYIAHGEYASDNEQSIDELAADFQQHFGGVWAVVAQAKPARWRVIKDDSALPEIRS